MNDVGDDAARLPPLVVRAHDRAAHSGFEDSCIREVGRLPRDLVGQVEVGTVGETGSGTGVGTAWLAAGLCPGVRLMTVESDPR